MLGACARYVGANAGLTVKSMVIAHCFQYICQRYLQRIMECHPPPSASNLKHTSSTASMKATPRHHRMGSRQDVPSSDDDDALANALASPEATPLMSLRPISPLASNVIINDIQLLQVWQTSQFPCIRVCVCRFIFVGDLFY